MAVDASEMERIGIVNDPILDYVNRAAIGMRQPVPNARSVTFNPGAACLRLNSAPRTIASTR